MHQAMQIAIGFDWEGRRNVPSVELANRGSGPSGKDFLLALKDRGRYGLESVVSGDHAALKAVICGEGQI